MNDDVITIGDRVSVFVLEGDQTEGWTFFNESEKKYLYATEAKKLAEGETGGIWTLSDTDGGVIMSYDDFGTMLYNASSPRFNVYNSNPTASMIQAHLFMEYADGVPSVVKQDVEMSFNPEAITVTIGEPFTEPVLVTNPQNLVVTYRSTDAEVANVDRTTGKVTLVGPGTATIMAAFAGDDAYKLGVAVYTLTVKKADTPVGPIGPVGDVAFQLVTDAATLEAGNRILIAWVDESSTFVMSTNQKTNNREATTDVTRNADGSLTPGSAAQLITLEEENGCFLFNVGDGYLYAASGTANHLKTIAAPDENAQALITIAADGDATIVFQGLNTRNHLRFNPNSGSPIFSCYASSSSVKSLPRIYRAVPQEDTPTFVAQPSVTVPGSRTVPGPSSPVVISLSGQRVSHPTKGLYIVGGKKVIIK